MFDSNFFLFVATAGFIYVYMFGKHVSHCDDPFECVAKSRRERKKRRIDTTFQIENLNMNFNKFLCVIIYFFVCQWSLCWKTFKFSYFFSQLFALVSCPLFRSLSLFSQQIKLHTQNITQQSICISFWLLFSCVDSWLSAVFATLFAFFGHILHAFVGVMMYLWWFFCMCRKDAKISKNVL